jgi:catechol 2,3-dioxygenase-like lactoylglutathione lyase family enzyme
MCHGIPASALLRRRAPVITGFGLVCLNVHDLDVAKGFYVDTLGFDVAMDSTADGFRWLVLTIPGQPETPLMLVVPGPPNIDEQTGKEMLELVARGHLGLGALRTDDCRATYEELKVKGVEFTEEPEERFYGIDASFRDPSGNFWRLTQPKALDEMVAPGS